MNIIDIQLVTSVFLENYKVWRKQWNIHGKASDSEQVKIKRKPLEISDISVFCQVEKMQTTTEY